MDDPLTDEPITEQSVAGRFWRPELDVLRGFAFMMVFVHHAFPQTVESYLERGFSWGAAESFAALAVAGGWGVDVFFCLSAYLITEILRREHQRSLRIDVFAFLVRRALRIWPLYFGFLLFAVVAVPRIIDGNVLPRVHLIAFLAFAGNWSIARFGYPPSVAAPLWSVSIEEQFYVMWPPLLLLVGFRRRRLIALTVVLLVVSIVTRGALVYFGAGHPAIWCNTLARLDPIALGACTSFFLGGRLPTSSTWMRFSIGGASIVAMIVAGALGGFSGARALYTYPLAAVASLGLLLAFLGVSWPAGKTLDALGFLGRISYGLYVFHVFAIVLVMQVSTTGSMLGQAAWALAGTIGMATLSWVILERRALRFKSRFSRLP